MLSGEVTSLLCSSAAGPSSSSAILAQDRSRRIGIEFLDFFDQWDPKSPWADRRVPLAASLRARSPGAERAETLGASRPT